MSTTLLAVATIGRILSVDLIVPPETEFICFGVAIPGLEKTLFGFGCTEVAGPGLLEDVQVTVPEQWTGFGLLARACNGWGCGADSNQVPIP